MGSAYVHANLAIVRSICIHCGPRLRAINKYAIFDSNRVQFTAYRRVASRTEHTFKGSQELFFCVLLARPGVRLLPPG